MLSKIRLDVAKGRLERLELGDALLTEHELHIGTNRSHIGAAIVVHRPLALQVPPGRGIHFGKVHRQRQRECSDAKVRIPQAEQDGGDLARVVGPARRIEHKGRDRRAPAVGDRQLDEHRLQIELGVSQADIALAPDRPAVADHAVDLETGLHSAGPYARRASPWAARHWDRGPGAARNGGGMRRHSRPGLSPGSGAGSSRAGRRCDRRPQSIPASGSPRASAPFVHARPPPGRAASTSRPADQK